MFQGRRGNLEINMISPRGTKSNILGQRPHDVVQSAGFNRYEFLSVEFWDEDPRGKWKIEFVNLNPKSDTGSQISPLTLKEVEIRFRGSEGFSQDGRKPDENKDQPADPKEYGSKERVLRLDPIITVLLIYSFIAICKSM